MGEDDSGCVVVERAPHDFADVDTITAKIALAASDETRWAAVLLGTGGEAAADGGGGEVRVDSAPASGGAADEVKADDAPER